MEYIFEELEVNSNKNILSEQKTSQKKGQAYVIIVYLNIKSRGIQGYFNNFIFNVVFIYSV